MKTKTKLTLGVGLLFLLIILMGVMSVSYINALKKDTENILEANYNTLLYSRNMLSALDENANNSLEKFEANLKNQENNVSEIGEQEATDELKSLFESYKMNTNDVNQMISIRLTIYKLMEMNIQAIERKSDHAKETASTATIWIAGTGTLCFLIAFVLLVNLPSNIANPIKELTRSIKEIASENYAERVNFESHSEFGDVARFFNTMAEKLEEYNSSNLAKLMMEKKRIEALINNMNDPVIGLDENLRIIFANEKALAIIGISSQKLIGHFSQELAVRNDLIRMLIQDLVGAESDVKSRPLKIYSEGKEGYFEKDTLHLSIVPTGEETPRLIGHVIILRNITEYKELDFAKTNFIATVSHEFKTSISSIKLSLQLLENLRIGNLNKEQQNLLSSINEDTNRLLTITGELLNMTQVESGKIQLAIRPSDPVEILQYAVNASKVQADQKKIRFEISYPDDLAKVNADSDKTAWVLTNLLSNAIRYSYENSIIYLNVEEEDGKIIYTVKDTGQGIAPQFMDKIFDRYFRVPGTNKEGIGLGLAISKEFVEAEGGKITAESEYGSGCTFRVELNKVLA